ncbi:MAG: hypothetical protein O3C43_02630 [Verrucomicrobia bacterium]|nr:hypothetical protein [Verrucomicrobiota bacterium]MDA1065379.1 hypothetical protein [Verrucomicrobiota bacterium]
MPKIPQWIQQLIGSEESIEPVLVSGNWFVSRAFSVPEGLKDKELEEFAELSVEEISPFNLEQLNWGYFYGEESSRLFIYAAFDQKLRKDLVESEQFDYAFPDFVQSFGLKFERATLIFLVHETTLSGILLPANDEVPQTVVGITLDPEFSPSDLEDARKRVVQRIEIQVNRRHEPTLANPIVDFGSVEVSDIIYTRNWEFKESKAKPSLELVPYGDSFGKGTEVGINETGKLWAMDVRKADAKEELAKKHGWSLWYWRGTMIVLLLFFILAAGEVGLLAFTKWNEKQLLIALEKEPRASDVMEKSDILAKINQITTNQLLPFEMLTIVNEYRPETIWFTRFIAEGGNAVQVEAAGLPSSDINGFQEALRDVEVISNVTISNNRVANNQASFRMRIEFQPGALEPQTFIAEL